MSAPFADRATAGRLLGLRLRSLDLKPPSVVLAPAAQFLAVPVAPSAALRQLRTEVGQVVCLDTPDPCCALGEHDLNFRQFEDGEVIDALARSALTQPAAR